MTRFRDRLLKVADVDLGPPPARNRARFPFTGTVEFQGLRVRVETRKGDTRSGTDRDGKAWSVVMPAHYGEFAGTEGTDGDPVDVFVGSDAHAPFAYVLHLQHPGTGRHDEDKVFLGFPHAEAARECFRAAYTRRDLQLGTMRKLSVGELRDWLERRGEKIVGGQALHKATPWRERLAEFAGLDAHPELEKGRNHKYLTRAPTGDPKRPWRYVYKITERHGVVAVAHEADRKRGKPQVGDSYADGRGEGHWHVIEADHADNHGSGRIKIRHDETGETRVFFGDASQYRDEAQHHLARFINEAHGATIHAERTRRKEARRKEAHDAWEVVKTLHAAQAKNPTMGVHLKLTAQVNLYLKRSMDAEMRLEDHMDALGVSRQQNKTLKAHNKELSGLHNELSLLFPTVSDLSNHLFSYTQDATHTFEANDPEIAKKALRYAWLVQHQSPDDVEDATYIDFEDILKDMGKVKGRWTHDQLMTVLSKDWHSSGRPDEAFFISNPRDDLDNDRVRQLHDLIVSATGKARVMLQKRTNFDARKWEQQSNANGRTLTGSVNSAFEDAFSEVRTKIEPHPGLYRDDYLDHVGLPSVDGITKKAQEAAARGYKMGAALDALVGLPKNADPVIAVSFCARDPKTNSGLRAETVRGRLSHVREVYQSRMATDLATPRAEHAERVARVRKQIEAVAAAIPNLRNVRGVETSKIGVEFAIRELERKAAKLGTTPDEKMVEHVKAAHARGIDKAVAWGDDVKCARWTIQQEVFRGVYDVPAGENLALHPEWKGFTERHRMEARDRALATIQEALGYKGDAPAALAKLERFTPEEAKHVRVNDTTNGKLLETVVHPYDLDRDNGGLKKLLSFMHPDVAPRARVEGVELKDAPDEYWRAHCTRDNIVRIWQGSVKEKKEHGYRTLWHEFGHAIEHASKGITQAANTLRDERGKNSPRAMLREITGNPGFADHEVAYEDAWAEGPYVGKWYGHNSSTEVLAMGVEALFDDPEDFQRRDPDHFHFTVAALAGRLGGADRDRHGDATEKLRQAVKGGAP